MIYLILSAFISFLGTNSFACSYSNNTSLLNSSLKSDDITVSPSKRYLSYTKKKNEDPSLELFPTHPSSKFTLNLELSAGEPPSKAQKVYIEKNPNGLFNVVVGCDCGCTFYNNGILFDPNYFPVILLWDTKDKYRTLAFNHQATPQDLVPVRPLQDLFGEFLLGASPFGQVTYHAS